ncbi:hypothetical protein RR48_10713 [Papilio machaon]|uniref:Uncharacterized protein n=1 Tax=Papilio machaon TaxID=76193 RepID=A0A194RMX7_PAPMA|nr:hypothetical protein RR48_10713 [Papilio machaon]
MEEEETALHVIQHCPAVSDYRDRYLGPPRSPPEITSNIKGLLGFFGELGWLELPTACLHATYALVVELRRTEPLLLTN